MLHDPWYCLSAEISIVHQEHPAITERIWLWIEDQCHMTTSVSTLACMYKKVKPQTLSFTEPEGGAGFALFCFPLLLPDPCILCNFSCPNSILSKSDSQLIDSSLPLSTFLSNNLQSFTWKAVEVESNSLQDFSIFFAISDIPVREVKKKSSHFSFKYPYNFIPVFTFSFSPYNCSVVHSSGHFKFAYTPLYSLF